jgi:hypothetical protein
VPAIAYDSIDAALTTMAHEIVKVIMHSGNATGDISHVLAAMANQPGLGVIVLDSVADKITTGHARVANVLVDHFKVPPDRVKFVSIEGPIRDYGKKGLDRRVKKRTFSPYSRQYASAC